MILTPAGLLPRLGDVLGVHVHLVRSQFIVLIRHDGFGEPLLCVLGLQRTQLHCCNLKKPKPNNRNGNGIIATYNNNKAATSSEESLVSPAWGRRRFAGWRWSGWAQSSGAVNALQRTMGVHLSCTRWTGGAARPRAGGAAPSEVVAW